MFSTNTFHVLPLCLCCNNFFNPECSFHYHYCSYIINIISLEIVLIFQRALKCHISPGFSCSLSIRHDCYITCLLLCTLLLTCANLYLVYSVCFNPWFVFLIKFIISLRTKKDTIQLCAPCNLCFINIH